MHLHSLEKKNVFTHGTRGRGRQAGTVLPGKIRLGRDVCVLYVSLGVPLCHLLLFEAGGIHRSIHVEIHSYTAYKHSIIQANTQTHAH